jgi:hypothetical protein
LDEWAYLGIKRSLESIVITGFKIDVEELRVLHDSILLGIGFDFTGIRKF